MTWPHFWLSPCGWWLHTASWMLCSGHTGIAKSCSTFPLQPDWIKLAISILNSHRSLRACLWPPGTGHSWKDIWLLNLCKNWANHFNPICYFNLLSTENRILERENLTKGLKMRTTMHCVISSWERCCTILQKTWHAPAWGCVNKGLTHHFTTQISYYNWGNATQLKQRDRFAMLSDLPPTLKISEVNKVFYINTRQFLSPNKMLKFFKNISIILLWNIVSA